jgi:hypothetical protein
MDFSIPSSDPDLLEKATRLADDFIRPWMREEVVGIVLLGAIPRGYFDRSADIDIAIFKNQAADIPLPAKFTKRDGMEIQCWISDYEVELSAVWDMPRRWTYSQCRIVYDPEGKIARLLSEKVPLRPAEARELLRNGFVLSEWYINRLTQLWVERGNIVSAHQMINQGLVYFFDLLFGWNHGLVPDMKWRYYCVERSERLPANFREGIRETMTLRSFSLEELNRRRKAFMGMWREMRPAVEKELGQTFEELLGIV